jgi:hypothetical protein
MNINWDAMTPTQRNSLVASTITGETKPYSTDLGCAFELVEALYNENQVIHLLHGGRPESNGPPVHWLCIVVTDAGKKYYGHGPASEAICIAALQANGFKVTRTEQPPSPSDAGTHRIDQPQHAKGEMIYDWSAMTSYERDALVSFKVMSQVNHVDPYTTDIVTAWHILDDHIQDNQSISLWNLRQADLSVPWDENLKWMCTIRNTRGTSFRCFAATAAAAICLNALIHHGVNVVFPHKSLAARH